MKLIRTSAAIDSVTEAQCPSEEEWHSSISSLITQLDHDHDSLLSSGGFTDLAAEQAKKEYLFNGQQVSAHEARGV